MKKIIYTLGFVLTIASVNAQAVNDIVVTGAAYANNVWYSLQNDEQGTQAYGNWDIALASTIVSSNPLTTSALVNHKRCKLFELPLANANPANFAGVDTAGLSLQPELFNPDTTWFYGAFNTSVNTGMFDYGWGTYNSTTHASIDANRVFVIKYNDGTFKKLMISLNLPTKTYTVTSANIDNSNTVAEQIVLTPYESKNFVYYALGGAVVDREPASTAWDLTFMQYPSHDYNPPYMVTGVLANIGVEVAEATPIADVVNYADYWNHTFTDQINEIGSDWKAFNNGWTIDDTTVYFVKDVPGNLWKMVFTNFTGSASGEYHFTKELISAAGINEVKESLLSVYPNPAQSHVTIVTDLNEATTLEIINQLGQVVKTETLTQTGLTSSLIDVNALENGVYYVKIAGNNKQQITKLQINK